MAGSWLLDPRYDAGLDRLAELQVQEAVLFAERARTLALLVARTSREGWQAEAPFDSLLLDVAGTCVLGQVAAGSRLTDAEHLVVRLSGTLQLLEEGRLAVHQAQVLVSETRDRTPDVCAEVERRVLPQAPSLCPGDLRRLTRRVVLEVDAAEQARREADACARRRVWVKPVEDGMALLCALLPADRAQAALAALSEHARQAAGGADGRCLDERRADLLVDRLVAGPAAGSDRPLQVLVHVPLATALGLSDAPGDLSGHGPISAAHARRLLDGAVLRRACVDPVTGEVWALDRTTVRVSAGTGDGAPVAAPLSEGDAQGPDSPAQQAHSVVERHAPTTPLREQHAGGAPRCGPGPALQRALLALQQAPPPVPPPAEERHDPSNALGRLVRVRDVRCDGIGCSVPASRCELDHELPWPDGETSAANLRARSQRCHHAKHHGWSVVRGPAGSAWTSPAGRRYSVPRRGSAPPPDTDTGPPLRRGGAT